MSYILDALRRADAERDRGAVPGLHSQQFGAVPGDDEAPAKPRLLIGIIAVLALALVGVLAWVLLAGPDPAPKTASPLPTPVTPAPAPVALAPVPVAPPAPTASVSAAPPASAATTAPTPATVRRPAPRPPVRRDTAAADTAMPSTAPASAGAATPGAPAGGGDRVYAQAELPEAIRRELPKLAFGGASNSTDKPSRLVDLNGQVFHEGDTVVPGVVVQQIRQKGAVLAFKGYRYEVGF